MIHFRHSLLDSFKSKVPLNISHCHKIFIWTCTFVLFIYYYVFNPHIVCKQNIYVVSSNNFLSHYWEFTIVGFPLVKMKIKYLRNRHAQSWPGMACHTADRRCWSRSQRSICLMLLTYEWTKHLHFRKTKTLHLFWAWKGDRQAIDFESWDEMLLLFYETILLNQKKKSTTFALTNDRKRKYMYVNRYFQCCLFEALVIY